MSESFLDRPFTKKLINASIAISGFLFFKGCEKCDCKEYSQDRTGRQQESGVMPYCFCGHSIEQHKGIFS